MSHPRSGFGTKACVIAGAIDWTVAFVLAPATVYRWKKQFAEMGTMTIRRLEQLEEQNTKLKRHMLDLSLDKTMLQDVLQKR